MPNRPFQFDDAEALRLVVEGTVAETGTDFFRALVRNLARVMDTAGAWVTEYLPEVNRLRARAFWLRDGFLEDYEHAVPNTPCEAVLKERKLVLFSDRILDIYPDEPDLKSLGAVSYMGELQNVIERALILATGPRIDLRRALQADPVAAPAPPEADVGATSHVLTADELEALERANLQRALAASGGKISGAGGAAQRLGLPASTVTSRMKALGIQRSGK